MKIQTAYNIEIQNYNYLIQPEIARTYFFVPGETLYGSVRDAFLRR